eukprot:CAMPEP_0183798666 /NCGR_PEP_ID=MMETSP0803_2-20130417/19457_1 /TAXON_ID=195967 /ORGANISM="Crustomastix stigmata, Strain CCMP3273" /LENGTH=403 /DNA_ID=CAMNT_0026043355 /DNA_START=63 /DNA_END=1274 /DNA_ORIENTATION=-
MRNTPSSPTSLSTVGMSLASEKLVEEAGEQAPWHGEAEHASQAPGRLPAIKAATPVPPEESERLSPDSVVETDKAMLEAASGGVAGGDGFGEPDVERAYDTLALQRLQQRWENHATEMDRSGQEFCDSLEALHTNLMTRAARVRNFDLKEILGMVQEHAMAARGLVLANYRNSRRLDGSLATDLYVMSKEAYETGLDQQLSRVARRHRDRVRHLSEENHAALEHNRQGAAVRERDLLLRQKQDITKELQREFAVERGALEASLTEAKERDTMLSKALSDAKHEGDLLKREIAVVRKELKLASTWKMRYEQAEARYDILVEETKQQVKVAEAKVQQMQDNMQLECGRRDKELERLRNTEMRLETELRDYKGDANIAYIRNDAKIEKKKSTAVPKRGTGALSPDR